MLTTLGVRRSPAQPKLLWIGVEPLSIGFDPRLVLQTVDIVFQSCYEAAVQSLRNEHFSAVVLATESSIDRTIAQLEEIVRIRPKLPVIIWIPNDRELKTADLSALGPAHVLRGNLNGDRLQLAIKSAIEKVALPESDDEWESLPWRRFLIGNSPAMLQLCETIHLISSRRATVLISGETGTGKEVAARAIHAASKRSALPMVAVNCTALPANLVESELFGHSKGAFTGAHTSRLGRFEQAHRSSIFLDEIGDLPIEAQAKLLRVLQEQEFERVGSSETIRVDVRVIAASNVDLDNAVRERRFREDLFYRLNVVPIRLPALRERRDDIPLLLEHFIEKTRAAENAAPKTISAEAVDFLSEQEWPGNVRQLEHTVQMAFALSGNRQLLQPADFALRRDARSLSCGRAASASHSSIGKKGINFDEVVATFELSLLNEALALTGGNKARAADLLKIKRTTLLAKMKVFEDRHNQQASLLGSNPLSNNRRGSASALVVEADNPIRRLIAKTLASLGYRVLIAANSSDAHELFACWGEHIKLLVVSADDPNESGHGLAASLQTASPDLLAVLLANNSLVNRQFTNSRQDYLQRPFSADELLRVDHHFTTINKKKFASTC